MRDLGLLGGEIRLKRTALEAVERIADGNLSALLEDTLLKEGRDTCDDVDAVDGFDASEELAGLRDRALDRLQDADCRGA